MLLQFIWWIRLNLQKLSAGTTFVLTTILIHVKSSHLLLSILTLGDFLQDAAQFILDC